MFSYLYVTPQSGFTSFGLLVLRIVVGGAFIIYGQEKAFSPMGWLDAFGVHGVPPVFQLIAFLTELIGGGLIVLGLLTPLVALLIVIDMLTAIFTFLIPHGVTEWISAAKPLTLEKNIFYIASMVLFITTGAGRYSIDALIARRQIS